MVISSRTPEGDPNRCPVCGERLRLEPSYPPGDAPCPCCGVLLWFDESEPIELGEPALMACEESGRSVRVKQGVFENYEGRVVGRYLDRPWLSIELLVFRRPTRVALEPGQVEFISK